MTEDMTPRPAPAYLAAHLTGLSAASVAVYREGEQVSTRIGTADCAIILHDHPAVMRQTATDIIAQLDAIEAGQ